MYLDIFNCCAYWMLSEYFLKKMNIKSTAKKKKKIMLYRMLTKIMCILKGNIEGMWSIESYGGCDCLGKRHLSNSIDEKHFHVY